MSIPTKYLLIIILLIAFFLRFYNLNYNSPFYDEAQYIVLGQRILNLEENGEGILSWVGGSPFFYPPIAAVFANFGITGARFLSVILGTICVYLIYLFGKNVRLSKHSQQDVYLGLASAALAALSAIPIYLSRLAIYDILSFTLFLLSLVLLTHALNTSRSDYKFSKTVILISSLAFFLSFLAKYTTLIFLPFIILWSYFFSRLERNLRVSFLLSLFILPASLLILLYLVFNFEQLYSFFAGQVSDVDQTNIYLDITGNYFEYNLPILLLAGLGSLVLLKHRQAKVLTLLLYSLVPLLVHLATKNVRTFQQHTFLILIFLIPLAAYFLFWLFNKFKTLGLILITLILAGVFFYSRIQLNELENSWTNTNDVYTFLKQTAVPGQKILSFEDDITILALPNINRNDITGIYGYEYNGLVDNEAYISAVKDGYFDFILVNEEFDSPASEAIHQSANLYHEVYNTPPFKVLTK